MANKKIKHIIAKLVGSSTEETMDVYDVDAVHTADVINNLTSNTEAAKKKPLSAYQGYVLNNNFNDSLSRSNIQSLAYRGEQTSGDANDMADGIRYFPGSSTNVPEQYCIIVQWGTSTYKVQIAVSMVTPNKLYQRRYGNAGWSSWYYTNMTVVS